MAVTNRYIWSKLSTGRPRGIVVKVKVYMCRGPGPIPKGAEIARTIRQQTQEGGRRPFIASSRRHTFVARAPRVLLFGVRIIIVHAAIEKAAASAGRGASARYWSN